MRKRIVSFPLVYLIYLGVLLAAVAAALLYVRSVLHSYEDSQPERQVEEAIAELVSSASSGELWEQYALSEVALGDWEQHLDLQKEYLALYTDGDLDFSTKSGLHGEDELYYVVENGGFPLAEIKLKAMGPTVTKLAIFSYREWEVESVRPVLEAHDYTLTVPTDFHVSVNGVALTAADGALDGNETKYTVSGVYLKPAFEITDKDGNAAEYTLKNDRVVVEFYQYTLTLPSALTVELNGEIHPGELLEDGRVRHDMSLVAKPAVKISDDYGNVFDYEGGDELPLTYMTITANDGYTVQVAGAPIPEKAVETYPNPDYATFSDFVEDLPQICVFHIAVLQEDAEIGITDAQGEPVALDPDKHTYDLSVPEGLAAVPDSVSAQIDVLSIAQSWSRFLTRDLTYAQMKKYLIPGSYQYEVATKYANGIDITFTSPHTLLDPAFTDNSVSNFVWITDTCFSVDISFVKHMRLSSGSLVDDPMNDRFYFVLYDDTNDNADNPTWKLASMKEIVNDAGR